MDLLTAKQAGEIASAIELRTQKRAIVNLAIAEGWPIIDVLARNPTDGNPVRIITGELDAVTSAQGLAFIKSIYDAQITALEAELAAIGTPAP